MRKLVTVKLPRNPQHDPHNKITAPCPVSPNCTDSTGEHHTLLVESEEILAELTAKFHITRIEDV